METKSKKYRYSVSASTQIKILVLVSVCKKVESCIPSYHTRDAKQPNLFAVCVRFTRPIPILLRFGLHESSINLEADFILSSADYVKPIVKINRRLSQAKNKQSFLVLTHKKSLQTDIRQNANITRQNANITR